MRGSAGYSRVREVLGAQEFSGIRLKFQGNVLYCARHRLAEDNLETAQEALCLLIGLEREVLFGIREDGTTLFESEGGSVEFYRSH